MKLTSSAFKHNTSIPPKFTCKGENVNPALHLRALPNGTKSLVIIVDDPDAPVGTWVHWVEYDIPPTLSIEENSNPGVQGVNDYKTLGYRGPCPPSGTHRYFFKVYALDTVLKLPVGQTKQQIEKAMTGHIIQHEELIGLFSAER